MIGPAWPLLALVLAARPSFAIQRVRLDGLERVYFERVGGPAPQREPPGPALLPDTLGADLGDLPEETAVRDFRLPPVFRGALVLRQVIDHSHPRISQLWWALYDNGRRSDVWYFTALPERNDDKVLANYEIESITQVGATIEFRIRGTMFRPQGAYSLVGKAFVFSIGDSALVLSRVRNVFGFFGSDGDGGPSVGVRAELERAGRFEERAASTAPAALLRRCGFRDPDTDEWRFSWAALNQAATCVTAGRSASRTYRAFTEPSFIERGGGARR